MRDFSNLPKPNDCDFCEKPGVNGTLEVDGENYIAICCETCADDERLPGKFTPFSGKK
jgi:hypothetical protein